MPKRPNKRDQLRQTATASTPQGELQHHIRELGLADADAYRAWCRENGFGVALNKGWHERRAELRHARKSAADADAQAQMWRHIQTLGLSDGREYSDWCARRGFSRGPRKGEAQLRRERAAAEREKAQQALAGARRRQRQPETTIERLYHGTASDDELRAPLYAEIHRAFTVASQAGEREALLRLLLHAHKRSRLLSLEPVVPHLGAEPGNTFPAALAALACHHEHWVRAPEEWQPGSHNPGRQFASLARHLLANYSVPAFMDAAWFAGNGSRARRQQGWFIHVGTGHNIRRADLPLPLTDRAAHFFLQAPADFSIEAAFRWGQVHALGGDEYLARAVAATRLGEILEDEAFWASVLHFFVNHPMLDGAMLGPIVDFVYHRKFAPQENVGPDGTVEMGLPIEPGFTMKGRTADALCRRVDEWHQGLAREAKKPPQAWPACDIQGFELTEHDEDTGGPVRWTVRELLSRQELVDEGRRMNHCVASYARSCGKGGTSIWSLRVEDCRTGRERSAMTIEVRNGRRTIVQARGRCNKLPGGRHASLRLNKAPAILRLWAQQERLAVPGYVLGG